MRVIETELELLNLKIQGKITPSTTNTEQRKKYKWTDDKVDLIELIYGILEKQSINNGDVNIKEIVKDLGAFFGVHLNNHSRIFINIKQRKNDSRTYYLDEVCKILNKKMNEDDLK